MAQFELQDFPAGGWVDAAPERTLQKARSQFQACLQLDSTQRTARYRLGLIAVQRQDYARAIDHLQIAHAQDPYHVGIRKALGYSYAWVGDLERAGGLLA